MEHTEHKYHGNCIYCTLYKLIGDELDEIRIVFTMEELIRFCIEEQKTPEEKRREFENYCKNLREKIIGGDNLEAIEEGMGIWPYIGGHCGYSYEDKCTMCINGCDFY